jgi:OmcA/MtrC family decaheme c-type cytochrome
MDLATAPEWTNGGSLSLRAGWLGSDYTNTGSGVVPAQPIRIDARDVGGAVTALGSQRYEAVFTLPAAASGTLSVHLEGRPVADLLGDGSFGDRIPVESAIASVGIDGPRAIAEPRREVVDPVRCAWCHDSGGAGLAFHGSNRVGNMTVCAVCHNPDATDLGQRPADPSTTPDGKREESIDFKRMVHQIHAGAQLEQELVLYGFGGTPNEYGRVEFLGNLRNCETCHAPGSYSGEAASAAAPTTIHTGADVADPADDLNISSTASVCSSCHDDAVAKDHMRLYGATFGALEAGIR